MASRGERRRRRRRRAPVIARGKRNLQVSSAREGIFATRREAGQVMVVVGASKIIVLTGFEGFGFSRVLVR